MEAVNGSKTVDRICSNVEELRALNRPQQAERRRVRDIMNNRQAMAALVGRTVSDPEARLPIANMMVRANQVLGQKIGRRPDVKKDPPVSTDSERAKKKADKEARIIESWDAESALELLLPQVGRWLPGYGFASAVVRQGMTRLGEPFPALELRDPMQSYPGEWGVGQQPSRIAFAYTMSKAKLAESFPRYGASRSDGYERQGGGVVLGAGPMGPSWQNQAGGGVEVYEYYDADGCWWVVPESKTLLSYVPNLLSGPQFRLVKRFCFDELTGVYDHAIGVMANMVRIALLHVIATEDQVMAPLDVIGELRGEVYNRSRSGVNHFTPGTTVQRNNSRIPFESFQQFDRYERQLRLITGHSQQDDGISPNSFVTGQGLQELGSQSSAEVRELFTAMSHWLQDLDGLRFEWAEKYYGDTEMRMHGVRQGAPFAETYVPSKDIAGDYVTRRVYGAMAGFDDATKIVTGLQLKQGGVLDTDTFREQIDGLENHERIKERILAEAAQETAMTALLAQAQNGDPKAMEAAIGLLPPGNLRTVLEGVFLAAAPVAAAVPPQPGGAPISGPPPDVQTVLARLSQTGAATGAAQTVGQAA